MVRNFQTGSNAERLIKTIIDACPTFFNLSPAACRSLRTNDVMNGLHEEHKSRPKMKETVAGEISRNRILDSIC